MARTEKNVIDQIEVTADNYVQVRRALVISKDGVEVSKTYHRHVLAPGADLSNEDPRVVAIAQAVWK